MSRTLKKASVDFVVGKMGDGRSEMGISKFGIRNSKWLRGAALALTLALSGAAQAQVTVGSTTNYTQNFDSLPSSGVTNNWVNNTTLAGWHLFNRSNNAIATVNVDTGTSSSGSFYSYGASSASSLS